MQESSKTIVKAFQAEMLKQYEESTPLPLYEGEVALFTCVKNGDVESLHNILKLMEKAPPVQGHMSDDPLKQAQFMVVSGITLATRYAIAGGMSQIEAYRLSDTYLQQLTGSLDEEQAARIFLSAIEDFATRVRKSKTTGTYCFPVTRCIQFINSHLYRKITLSELASYCDVTPQYLSGVFHRETGLTITAYIRKEKLKLASQMLENTVFSINRISTLLDFPSQSAFTEAFKEEYGTTPGKFRRK